MSKLIITELSLVGSELFQDTESFLEELTDDELDNIEGSGSIISVHNNSVHLNSVGSYVKDLDLEGVDIEDLDKIGLKGYYGSGKTINGHTIGNIVSTN